MPDIARIGLIGCGGIAGRHVQWLMDRGDCEIVSLCDTNAEASDDRAAQIKQRGQAIEPARFEDHADLLARDDIDGVCVLLAHGIHRFWRAGGRRLRALVMAARDGDG